MAEKRIETAREWSKDWRSRAKWKKKKRKEDKDDRQHRNDKKKKRKNSK